MNHAKQLCLLLLPMICLACWADEGSGFCWAWELPLPDPEKYPITRHYFWDPPQDFVNGGIGYAFDRARDNEDNQSLTYTALARPFVFQFENSTSLSIGVFGAGQNEFAEGGGFEIPPYEVNWEGQYAYYCTGISLFLSSPETGLQFYLDFGHYWGRYRLDTDNATEVIPNGTLPPFQIADGFTRGRVRALQRESGVMGFFQINYLVDRLYLYGAHLSLSWSVPTGPVDLESSALTRTEIPVDLGFGPVNLVQEDRLNLGEDEVKTHYVAVMLHLRAFAVELFQDSRITFEPGMGFAHYRMNNGHSFIVGGRLNIFDVLGLSILQNFEVNNDASDSLLVNIDIGFRFGRRMTGLNRLF